MRESNDASAIYHARLYDPQSGEVLGGLTTRPDESASVSSENEDGSRRFSLRVGRGLDHTGPRSAKGAPLAPADFKFLEPTELKDTIKAVARLTGKSVVLDRGALGKIQIAPEAPMTAESAFAAYVKAVEMLGLSVRDEGRIIKIGPSAP